MNRSALALVSSQAGMRSMVLRNSRKRGAGGLGGFKIPNPRRAPAGIYFVLLRYDSYRNAEMDFLNF